MEEKQNHKEQSKEVAGQENHTEETERLKLVLGDAFIFDGIEVKEIDMEGLLDLSAADMCAIDRQMIAMGYSGARMEITRQYAMLVAAKVNKKPWEYCQSMKARDSIRLRDMVTAFFYARG